MRKNSLGDRMKEYERTSDTKLVRRLPMIVRLDGKAFHSWTKKSGCVRPFDHTVLAERPQLEQPRNGREEGLLRLSPGGGCGGASGAGHANEVSC